MDVLIFAIESGRLGPARLPAAFHAAGLASAVLCPADNLLAQSRYAQAVHRLGPQRSAGAMAADLARALAADMPRLIVPGDEQTVALLQTFARGRCAAAFTPEMRALIAASLGDPAQFDASLLKSHTLALARELGLPVAPGATVASPAEALQAAEGFGYPVYLKDSFSWAGQGVSRCDDGGALREAFAARQPSLGGLRRIVRRWRGRDWYPAESPIDVQQAIAGNAAMFAALAWRGRMLGGFAGNPLAFAWENGPSTAVRLGHDAAMARTAEAMIAAMGFTGLLAFDFVVAASGEPLLIECNPRPIPVTHLGPLVGVDLAELLAQALRGEPGSAAAPIKARRTCEVLLFPHALDPAAGAPGMVRDIPDDEPGLIRHVRGDAADEDRAAA